MLIIVGKNLISYFQRKFTKTYRQINTTNDEGRIKKKFIKNNY